MDSYDNMLAALKRERAGYVSRGLDDRVDQVDKQIALLRGDNTPQDEPQGRTAVPQQTADQGGKPTAKKTAARKPAAPAVADTSASETAGTPDTPPTE